MVKNVFYYQSHDPAIQQGHDASLAQGDDERKQNHLQDKKNFTCSFH